MLKVKPRKYICAVDIETLGHANSAIPFSVGFCFGTCWADRRKVRISILPDTPHVYHNDFDKTFNDLSIDFQRLSLEDQMKHACEPCTWSEFWSKNTNVLGVLMKEALPIKDGFQLLSNTIKQIYSTEHMSIDTKTPYRVTFLGDNPGYDFSHLNAALEKYCDELPIRYSNRRTLTELRNLNNVVAPTDGYHGISDPSEQIEFHRHAVLIDILVEEFSVHSHLPDDDAEGIYLRYLLIKDPKFLGELIDKSVALKKESTSNQFLAQQIDQFKRTNF